MTNITKFNQKFTLEVPIEGTRYENERVHYITLSVNSKAKDDDLNNILRTDQTQKYASQIKGQILSLADIFSDEESISVVKSMFSQDKLNDTFAQTLSEEYVYKDGKTNYVAVLHGGGILTDRKRIEEQLKHQDLPSWKNVHNISNLEREAFMEGEFISGIKFKRYSLEEFFEETSNKNIASTQPFLIYARRNQAYSSDAFKDILTVKIKNSYSNYSGNQPDYVSATFPALYAMQIGSLHTAKEFLLKHLKSSVVASSYDGRVNDKKVFCESELMGIDNWYTGDGHDNDKKVYTGQLFVRQLSLKKDYHNGFIFNITDKDKTAFTDAFYIIRKDNK
jgi:hypothetical protein